MEPLDGITRWYNTVTNVLLKVTMSFLIKWIYGEYTKYRGYKLVFCRNDMLMKVR